MKLLEIALCGRGRAGGTGTAETTETARTDRTAGAGWAAEMAGARRSGIFVELLHAQPFLRLMLETALETLRRISSARVSRSASEVAASSRL